MATTNRVIILIDMDCFYCQVEEKLNPNLKDKPIAVVQYNQWRGGGIIAVNYPARDQGVTRHMRGKEAKEKCPIINLVQVPEVRGKADLTKYREAGKEVAAVLATFTPLLQRASVDEAYLDVTDQVEKRLENLNELNTDNLANTFVVGSELPDFLDNVKTNREFSLDNLKLAFGALICEEIRAEVFKITGYKCSAGIAHNKILAKLVCSLHKPNKQTILPQDAVAEFFETIPIKKITSLGGKFGQNLVQDFNITYMSELAKIPEKQLAQKYDEKAANFLYNIARGVDLEPVTTKLISKSIACCKNFTGITALKTSENIELWLSKLAEEMSERLDKDLKENNRKAKQIIVSFVQEINKKDVSSSRTLPLNSYESQRITRIAFDAIKKNCMRNDGSYHVKFMGLNASNFEDIKNVREITSFFQIGQKRKPQEVPNLDHSENGNCSNFDTSISDSSIYQQSTQELEENIDELIFYDDSKRLKLNKAEDKSNTIEITQPSKSSFFANYFKKEALKPEIEIEPELEQNSTEIQEETEVCSECQKVIPISDLQSHQDYHFAVKLSKSENLIQKPTPKTETKNPKGRSKATKRKSDPNSNTLMDFFKKEETDVNAVTEICSECNKKIKIEEFSSHMDYHTAKKIHMEINAVKPPENVMKSPKTKINKSKKVIKSNKSVKSFFKPE